MKKYQKMGEKSAFFLNACINSAEKHKILLFLSRVCVLGSDI